MGQNETMNDGVTLVGSVYNRPHAKISCPTYLLTQCSQANNEDRIRYFNVFKYIELSAGSIRVQTGNVMIL